MGNLSETREETGPVRLRTPRSPGCLRVMRVVLGGVASRHDLPVDALDDIDLAVETLLAGEPPAGGHLELTVNVTQGTYRLCLAGLRSQATRKMLAPGSASPQLRNGGPLDVRRILESLVDSFSVEERPGDTFTVCLEKRVPK